jgi:hypothetical protein
MSKSTKILPGTALLLICGQLSGIAGYRHAAEHYRNSEFYQEG